jgi:cation diffusion facilitator CzcD-associated flavoprotein CzcO
MSADVAHITMIQRSPTYVISLPSRDPAARLLRLFLPDAWVAKLVRRKNIFSGSLFYNRTRSHPNQIKSLLLKGVQRGLGGDYDIETHFTPRYDPWDQRLCLIPDGDLYRAIKSGTASVVTDRIDRFTADGVLLASGQLVEADIIVTATGLQLVTLGEAEFTIDGEPVDFSQTWSYKGISYSDVPNLASTFGYINASWTLRSDMVAEFVCRTLNHMTATGNDVVVPRLRPGDANMAPRPWIDDFSSGYITRMLPLLPRQGDREPWVNTQSYHKDLDLIAKAEIDDGVLTFSKTASQSRLESAR